MSGTADRLGDLLAALPLRVHGLLPEDQRDDLRHRVGRYRPWEQGATAEPPGGPGAPRPPDFVGVGAQLCGLRWWGRLVATHPEVAPGSTRATHHLGRAATGPFGDAEVAAYHRWFGRTVPERIDGEWTPGYLALPWVPPLLARAAPEARLVVLVRDPVARAAAAWARSAEHRATNLGAELADVVERGRYGRQLRELVAHVPARQVLVLQYERCRDDRDGALAETFRFLGVDDGFRVPASPVPSLDGPPLPTDAATRLADLYAPDLAELVALAPSVDPGRWGRDR
jgi:hypothetical protein